MHALERYLLLYENTYSTTDFRDWVTRNILSQTHLNFEGKPLGISPEEAFSLALGEIPIEQWLTNTSNSNVKSSLCDVILSYPVEAWPFLKDTQPLNESWLNLHQEGRACLTNQASQSTLEDLAYSDWDCSNRRLTYLTHCMNHQEGVKPFETAMLSIRPDFEGLKKLHRYLFKNIYSWAGQSRDELGINIFKIKKFYHDKNDPNIDFEQAENFVLEERNSPLGRFVDIKDMGESARQLFDKLKTSLYSADNMPLFIDLRPEEKNQEFITVIASLSLELNYLHPFREGNGSAIHSFIGLLAADQGVYLDTGKIRKTHPDLLKKALKKWYENDDTSLMEKYYRDSVVPQPYSGRLRQVSVEHFGKPLTIDISTTNMLTLPSPCDKMPFENSEGILKKAESDSLISKTEAECIRQSIQHLSEEERQIEIVFAIFMLAPRSLLSEDWHVIAKQGINQNSGLLNPSRSTPELEKFRETFSPNPDLLLKEFVEIDR